MGKYPDREKAEQILREAEERNPGPWGNHSRTAAHCAEKIAEHAGLNADKAYVLGLLHDIGRRFGKRHLGHVSDGYSYMMSLGYDEVAQICLTHSFNQKKMEGYVGKFDTSEEETELIRTKLAEAQYDDYDRLIQLCDAISGAEGVMNIIDRMSDVKRRYGDYDPGKWNANLALKEHFEQRMGMDLYEAVEKDRFRPGLKVYRCQESDWLLSEEAFELYAPCMYQPTFEKYAGKMMEYLSDSAVRIYVCERGGSRAGILVLHCSREEAVILGIAVSEACRGGGVGQYLIRGATQSEKLKTVTAQTDDDAIGFYRKCGFRDEETSEEYPNGTAVRYTCTLSLETGN